MPDHRYTAEDKLRAVERELAYRARVYGRRVVEGKMTQQLADEQIALFESIAADYRELAQKDRLL